MRTVELRRHTERDENEDLTPRGLEIAARARETLETPYDAHYVSPQRRARLTMEAFGVHDALVERRFDARPRPPFAPFEPRWRAIRATGLDAVTAWFAVSEAASVLRDLGRRVREAVIDVAAGLPEEGRALVVSHGGTIEPFAVVALHRPYPTIFGSRELGYCEGVRANLEGGRVVRVDIVRL